MHPPIVYTVSGILRATKDDDRERNSQRKRGIKCCIGAAPGETHVRITKPVDRILARTSMVDKGKAKPVVPGS